MREQVEEIVARSRLHVQRADYDRDAAVIVQLLEEAQSLQDQALQAFILDKSAVFYSAHGRLHLALERYEQLYEVLAQPADSVGQMNTLYRRAELYIALADYDLAVGFIEVSLDMLDLIHPPPEDRQTRQFLYINTLALAFTLKGDYVKAATTLEQWTALRDHLDSVEADQFGDMMLIAHRCNAFIRLLNGDPAGAMTEAETCIVQSTELHIHRYTIAGILLKAMIALRYPSLGVSPDACWSEIETCIEKWTAADDPALWAVANHSLLEGSREFEHLGYPDWALRCARKAVEILTLIKDVERRIVAETIVQRLEWVI